MLQAPAPSAGPDPTRTGPPPNPLSANKSTLLFGSVVPAKVGLVDLVMLSVADAPVSSEAIRSGGGTGLAGGCVSIVTLRAADANETLPAGSVAVTVI